ncbi:MAG: tRNA (N6-threonylcarbamoyladenosine(37)-N6)-methyltransferase TrmO [Methanobacteriota archaeon]|nr:MAG: tRNA (N6-threonylcarbamoyladenosine(37)-N6)-methyltransferase TrmO [Euryarchaeota archaeon]
MPEKDVTVRVIGHVKNEITSGKVEDWGEVESEIVLNEEYESSLDGIEQFSHIVVVFWMDQVHEYTPKVHPQSREDIPKQGVFATRTPFRPNPIGISAVKLLSREGSVLKVMGLDCFDRTPVLDIKPYNAVDVEKIEFKVPGWMRRLMDERKTDNPRYLY